MAVWSPRLHSGIDPLKQQSPRLRALLFGARQAYFPNFKKSSPLPSSSKPALL